MVKASNSWIFGLVIAVLAISVVFFVGGDLSVTGGATVMSIDNANFVSNNPELNADAYLIDVIVNKGGEELTYTVNPDEVCQYLDGPCPKEPFTIKFDLNSVSCNYQITDAAEPFYKIYQATTRSGLIAAGASCPYNNIDLSNVKSHCAGNYNSAAGTALPTPSSTPDLNDCDNLVNIQTVPVRPDLGQQASEWCYAMPPDRTGDGDHWRVTHIAGAPKFKGYDIGTVASPQFAVDVIIENSAGDEERTTITNTQTVALLGSIGRVKFAGSLLAQEFCPVPAIDYKVVENVDDNNMLRLVDEADYEQYQDNLFELINLDNNYYEYTFIQRRTDPGVGADVIFDKMSTLNALHRELAAQDLSGKCAINGTFLRCIPERDVVYPELQILLRADWVGIRINSGVPEIQKFSVPDESFEGDVNTIKVTIDNVGEADDSFDTLMKCDGSVVNLGTVRTPIGAGDRSTVNANYILNDGNYSCSITVTSVNNPLATDTKTFEIEVLQKEFPTIAQCEEIPTQPTGNCFWEGHPICEWKCFEKGEESNNYTLLLIMIAIIGGLIAIIVWYVKKR